MGHMVGRYCTGPSPKLPCQPSNTRVNQDASEASWNLPSPSATAPASSTTLPRPRSPPPQPAAPSAHRPPPDGAATGSAADEPESLLPSRTGNGKFPIRCLLLNLLPPPDDFSSRRQAGFLAGGVFVFFVANSLKSTALYRVFFSASALRFDRRWRLLLLLLWCYSDEWQPGCLFKLILNAVPAIERWCFHGLLDC